MTTSEMRPRVLLADGDAPRRRAAREALGGDLAVAEAASADEVLAWLDQAEPGITLLDHTLPGASGAELVGRVHELHPHEVVLFVANEPSVGFCRAAMRAGAYDCLDRADLHPAQLRAVCESAGERLEEAARARRAASAVGRATVRDHERGAAGRLSSPAVLTAWKAVDLEERQRWLDSWSRALQAVDVPGERANALSDLLDDLSKREHAADLLLALHVHATSSVRLVAREDLLDRSREVLVDAFARLTHVLARAHAAAPAKPLAPRSIDEDLLWHRWCLADGGEEWMLVGDGRPLARVSVVAGGCRAWLRDAETGNRVVPATLPAIPEGLREVERRLGLPHVLSVRSASVCS